MKSHKCTAHHPFQCCSSSRSTHTYNSFRRWHTEPDTQGVGTFKVSECPEVYSNWMLMRPCVWSDFSTCRCIRKTWAKSISGNSHLVLLCVALSQGNGGSNCLYSATGTTEARNQSEVFLCLLVALCVASCKYACSSPTTTALDGRRTATMTAYSSWSISEDTWLQGCVPWNDIHSSQCTNEFTHPPHAFPCTSQTVWSKPKRKPKWDKSITSMGKQWFYRHASTLLNPVHWHLLRERHIQPQQHRKTCTSLRELLTSQAAIPRGWAWSIRWIINETNSSSPRSHFFSTDASEKQLDSIRLR